MDTTKTMMASNDETMGGPAGVGFADLVDLIRRNALLIAVITLSVTILTGVALSRVQPRYSACAL